MWPSSANSFCQIWLDKLISIKMIFLAVFWNIMQAQQAVAAYCRLNNFNQNLWIFAVSLSTKKVY